MYKSRNSNTGTEAEERIFWLGLIICPLIWTFFFFTSLFSLKIKWLVRLPLLAFSAYVLDCILSLSDSSVCLPQSVVVASISLQAANLYGYLRCKAGGQDGHPPDNRSFTGQQLPQRVSVWLHHVASAVVLLTCHFTLIL